MIEIGPTKWYPTGRDEGLVGRRAVVTGAARGIGAATVQELIERGANVVAIDKDDEVKRRFDGRCECHRCDFLRDDVVALADELQSERPVELVVNNIGISTAHGTFQLEEDIFREVLETNLIKPFAFTRRLMRDLADAGTAEARAGTPSRAVVFISSIHDRFVARLPHYSSSKAAVSMLSKELAVELGPLGVRVNAVSPGWIRTSPDHDSDEQRAKAERLLPRIPLGRAGRAKEVAELVMFLLDDRVSGYITGANITIDGGLSLTDWVSQPGDDTVSP